MLTAGWRKIGNTRRFDDVAALQDISKARRPPRNSDWIEALRETDIPYVTRAFNCLSMTDPEQSTDHLGLASGVLERIWEQHRDAVLEIMKLIQDDVERDAPGVTTYLFWCTSGRHRSVAMAMLAKLFLQAEGFEVPDDRA